MSVVVASAHKSARTAAGGGFPDEAVSARGRGSGGPALRTRPGSPRARLCRRLCGMSSQFAARGSGGARPACAADAATRWPRGSSFPRTSLRGRPRGMSPQTRGREGERVRRRRPGHETAVGITASAEKSARTAVGEAALVRLPGERGNGGDGRGGMSPSCMRPRGRSCGVPSRTTSRRERSMGRRSRRSHRMVIVVIA